ncbi:MAG TPA: type 4a pilus biogenesis protein PilO [Thiobacillaceae bacterium]|nr:type 4a pilus biogenesis protein PilO [Thiobacillaceae bacterium]
MNLDLNNLDLRTIADWPLGAKLTTLGLLFVLITGAGWWFDWKSGLDTLEVGQRKEQELKATFVTKKGQAINLQAYQQQLKDIEQAFGALLKQLPNRQEMDALITDVNQAGLGRGLQFELFKPDAEIKSEFYAQTPIKIKVTGGYHDMAAFTSDVAKLPRIVTLHDIAIAPEKDGTLTMEATAKTYRYLDEDEVAAQQQAKMKEKAGKGGKK